MNYHILKSILAAGVLTVFSLGFTACNSSTDQHQNEASQMAETTEGDQPEESMGSMNTNGSSGTEAPDYRAVEASFKEQIESIYQQYLKVKDALVEARTAEATKAAQGVLEILSGVDAGKLSAGQKAFYEQQASLLKQQAQAIVQAGSVAEQRKQLDGFSASTFALVKAFGANDETAYYQYCPMAKASWISKTAEIRNPYMGQKMLSCGETKEKLASP